MSVIDDYLKKIDPPERAELERIRSIVKQMVPDAEEVIAYGMPGFKYRGKYLLGYNALKDHLSLFPTSEPIEQLAGKLSDFKLSRGTIRFQLDHPIPEDLIKEIVAIRLKAISTA